MLCFFFFFSHWIVFYSSFSATDRSRLRLAAAAGMVKIAEGVQYQDSVSLRNFQQVALTMQVPHTALQCCSKVTQAKFGEFRSLFKFKKLE